MSQFFTSGGLAIKVKRAWEKKEKKKKEHGTQKKKS